MIELLRIPLKNRPGQLHEVVTLVSKAGVDMKALSLTHLGGDGSEVLMLVTNLASAREALEKAGRTISTQTALVIEVDDHAGGLAACLEAMMGVGLSINDLFTFVTHIKGKALTVATFDDTKRAEELLRKAGVPMVDQQTINSGPEHPATGPHLLDDYLGGPFFW